MTKSKEEIDKIFERQDVLLRLGEVHILEDRHFGVYSGGKWVAVANYDENLGKEDPEAYPLAHPFGDDVQSMEFWWKNPVPDWVGVGNTPNNALANLYWKNGTSYI